jgi:MerR family copper efflux transcriptional regulator
MRIGELAARADVNIDTIRYYERRGLLEPPERLASGYRTYGTGAVQRVSFIRRAQAVGFTLHEIEDLLALWNDSADSCKAVEERARVARERIDTNIRDLTRMRRALDQYVAACQHRPALDACPLLQELGGSEQRRGNHQEPHGIPSD